MTDTPVIYGPDAQPLAPSVRQAAQAQVRRASMSTAYDASAMNHPSLIEWVPATWSGQSALTGADRNMAAARIHDVARNSGWASAATDRIVDETIGSGWTLNAEVNAATLNLTQDQADEINDRIEALAVDYFNDPGFWCDAERQTNAAGILGLAMRHDFLDGESCAHVVWRGDAVTGAPLAPTGYGTALQVIDPARLSNPRGVMDSALLQQGVALDEWGAAIGYHVRRTHPGDRMMTAAVWQWDYVPRDIEGRPNFIHAFRRRRAGERRGVSKFVSVLKKHRQIEDIDDLELGAISVNSALAAFVESPFDLEELADSISPEAFRTMSEAQDAHYKAVPIRYRGAQVNFLKPGEKITLARPEHPNANFEAFFRQALQNVASGLGLTYEMLTMDWSNVNYSSARAAMLVIYKSLNAVRDGFAAQFMAPWHAAWLEEVFDRRLITLPAGAVSFEANRAGWCRATWIGTGRGWIDPKREAEASAIRLSAGITTLQAEMAEQGLDFKTTTIRRAREQKLLQRMGLVPVPQAAPVKTDAKDDMSPDDEIEGDVNGRDSAPAQQQARVTSVPRIARR